MERNGREKRRECCSGRGMIVGGVEATLLELNQCFLLSEFAAYIARCIWEFLGVPVAYGFYRLSILWRWSGFVRWMGWENLRSWTDS